MRNNTTDICLDLLVPDQDVVGIGVPSVKMGLTVGSDISICPMHFSGSLGLFHQRRFASENKFSKRPRHNGCYRYCICDRGCKQDLFITARYRDRNDGVMLGTRISIYTVTQQLESLGTPLRAILARRPVHILASVWETAQNSRLHWRLAFHLWSNFSSNVSWVVCLIR